MDTLRRPKKSLGQNFLRSEKVLREFVDSCNLSKIDLVLEIGAGTGTITKELAERAGVVVAVEFDKDLIPQLKSNLKDYPDVRIIESNILSLIGHCDIGELFRNSKLPARIATQSVAGGEIRNYKVVGAIPYDITSPLIHSIAFLKEKPKSVHLIIQKEVAQKICAKAPNASYLSNLVALVGTAKIVKKIPPGAFYPVPKVHSAILNIEMHQKPANLDPKKFSDFLHRGFKYPRKKIKQVFSETDLKRAGIDANLRPENLKLEDWKKLYALRALAE